MERLIIGYFSDDLSLEELRELQEWRNASPENEAQFLAMQEVWTSSADVFDEHDGAYKRFLTYAGDMQGPIRRKKQLQVAWKSVATVVVLFLVSYVMLQIGGKQKDVLLANDTQIEVSRGSQVKTTLPDGTEVWLNADSRLTYSQDFGINNRDIHLIGEGYFEVAHNKNLPMTVYAGDLQINVIGTKFNVRNRLDDRETTVSLLEGSVSIVSSVAQSEKITIEPNQKIFFNRENGDFHLTDVVARYTIEWTKGYLFYDEEMLSDIARDLERNYDVRITVHPDVADLRLYGRFNMKTMSAEQITSILASTGGIGYSVTGGEITIK